MKRLLCGFVLFLLALCLVLPVQAAEQQTSGICGPNLFWTFDTATGTLTVIGEGSMHIGEYPPWQDLRYQITKVVISPGITSVGGGAFSDCKNLQTVILPDSITYIGSCAFQHCYNLQMPSIDNVTGIGDYAFASCGSITEIVFPAGLTRIGYSAFSGCHNLKSVKFPNGLQKIESYAFYKCDSLTSVILPDSVTEIGTSAFSYCKSLASVTLSSNLTIMQNCAFSDCAQLKKVVIPDSLTELNEYVFDNCIALEEVILGASICKIGSFSFSGCTSLQAFILSSENTNFRVDRGVLYDRSTNKLYRMPYGFQGSYDVLPGTVAIGVYACLEVKGLTGITLPDSITLIESAAFRDCKSLATVRLSNNLQEIEQNAFYGAAIREILIPGSVNYIHSYAFAGCTKLTKIVFVGEPPRCGNRIFYDCVGTAYYTGDAEAWKPLMGLDGDQLEWVPLSNAEHTPVTDPGKTPTCTQTGLTEGSHCSICMTVLIPQETIPVISHSYGQFSSKDDSTHSCSCTQCGKTEIFAHTWDMGTVEIPSGCTTQGQLRYTCTDCKHTKTEALAEAGHTHTDSCDTQCNECGEMRTITHSFSEVYSWDQQRHWRSCWVCGEKKDVGDHIPDENNACRVCGRPLASVLQAEPVPVAPSDVPSEEVPAKSTALWWCIASFLAGAAAVTILFLKKKSRAV